MPMVEYPALFSASDSASLAAQKTYLRLLRGQLALFILASLSSSIAAAAEPSIQYRFSTSAAIFLSVGLLLMWILRAQAYDKIWFDCRAVAESVKTAAWRYMMRASPYDLDEGTSNVDARFIKHLKEIRAARHGVEMHLAGLSPGGKEISDYMRRTRGLSLEEQKKVYCRDRLIDQKMWYEGRVRSNRRATTAWFWTVAGVQIFALILA